jgi:hypothetical protein
MHVVGHHLQIEAIRRHDVRERDLFARSAFNRYYYASFLLIRDAFGEMEPSWQTMPHKSYPTTLRGKVTQTLKRGRSQAMKLGDYQLEEQLRTSSAAAAELAKLLERAYGTRVAADYDDTPVIFATGQRFSLNSITITEAHEWSQKVQTLASTIKSGWRQIHA